MNRTVARTKLIFLGIFAVLAAASWGYQFIWVSPAKQCEEKRGWWDPEHRICAYPIDISTFTHRPHGVKRSTATGVAVPAASPAATQP